MENLSLSPNQIQNYILTTFFYKSNKEMAKALHVKQATIGANYSTLKIAGKITKAMEIERDMLFTLLKVNDMYQFFKDIANSYSNGDGENKQNVRLHIYKAMQKGGLVLSLPFVTCFLEELIYSNDKTIKFLGVECETETYKGMVQTIEQTKLPIEPYFGMLSDKINEAKADTFSNLILDYCKALHSHSDEITTAVENNIMSVGGAMCVTLARMGMSNNYGVVNDILSSIPKGMFGNVKPTELAYNLFFANLVQNNPNYVIENVIHYQDIKKDENGQPIVRGSKNAKVRTMPMSCYIIRRIK